MLERVAPDRLERLQIVACAFTVTRTANHSPSKTFSSNRWTSQSPSDWKANDAQASLHPSREVVRIAESIGFSFDRQRGSHAVYYRLSDKRRLVIPMHGSKDLKTGTLRGIINDMRLTVEEFTNKL